MQLLLDQGIPNTTAQRLRAININAMRVSELGMSTAIDADIIEFAKREGRVIVTLDSDFHTLLAVSSAKIPSVIRVRIEGLKAPAYLPLLQTVLSECEKDLKHGCAITIQNKKIRVHLLPIGDK